MGGRYRKMRYKNDGNDDFSAEKNIFDSLMVRTWYRSVLTPLTTLTISSHRRSFSALQHIIASFTLESFTTRKNLSRLSSVSMQRSIFPLHLNFFSTHLMISDKRILFHFFLEFPIQSDEVCCWTALYYCREWVGEKEEQKKSFRLQISFRFSFHFWIWILLLVGEYIWKCNEKNCIPNRAFEQKFIFPIEIEIIVARERYKPKSAAMSTRRFWEVNRKSSDFHLLIRWFRLVNLWEQSGKTTKQQTNAQNLDQMKS